MQERIRQNTQVGGRVLRKISRNQPVPSMRWSHLARSLIAADPADKPDFLRGSGVRPRKLQ
jgi:hypothetical protein